MIQRFISFSRCSLAGLIVGLIVMGGISHVHASVSLGPVTADQTDAKQHQVMMEYQAEQAHREQIKVGLERYRLKQVHKAAVLAGMAAQLHAQQQVVIFPATHGLGNAPAATAKWYWPPVFLAIFALFLFGAGFFLKYQRYQRTKTPSL
jgi:hypothetical protein